MLHVGFVKYFKVIKENEHIDCAKLLSVMASERISKEQQKRKNTQRANNTFFIGDISGELAGQLIVATPACQDTILTNEKHDTEQRITLKWK